MTATTHRIFDSLDRPTGPSAETAHELRPMLDRLTAEAEAENSRLTYAIGRIEHDGTVTFE